MIFGRVYDHFCRITNAVLADAEINKLTLVLTFRPH